MDGRHTIIRTFAVTSAEVHDSQVLIELRDETNTNRTVYADSAYRSAEHETSLKAAGYRSQIHRKGTRKHPLSAREQDANRTRSTVRARVEHVFAQQTRRIVRTIGKACATLKIALMNWLYNLRRLAWLSAPASTS